MKIPVIHVITLLELGGAQQNTLYTVAHLNREQFQPYLIAGQGGLLDGEASGLRDVGVFFVPRLRREISPLEDMLALGQMRDTIRRIIKDHPAVPAIVHTHSSKAGILGRWAARMEKVGAIIHTFHGFGFHAYQPKPLKGAFQLVELITSRITDGFVMVSKANEKVALNLGITKGRRVALIRSGISLEEFSYRPKLVGRLKKELNLPEHSKVVTQISCFKPQKAPADFVDVAARVALMEKQVFFLMVGDGLLRPDVEKAVASHGLENCFKILGWRRDVPEILHDTDVLVLTSLWEGLPKVLPQAMAAGVPAVVTRVDGSPEAILDGVNGFVVEPRDVKGMAARVVQLLRDPELRRKMGEEGKKRAQEFDINTMVRKQEEFYLELVEAIVERKNQKWIRVISNRST